MSKILVTGGAGYIGSIMTKRLLDEGHSVFIIDSLERGVAEHVDKRATLAVFDLINSEKVDEFFSNNQIDSVIHFAGYISVAQSMENPSIYFQNNIRSSVNLLEGMEKKGVKNIIFSSTAAVYGNPVSDQINEDHPKNPTNVYGESKLMVENILKWYNKIYGISFATLRYFNASGALLDGSLGEQHNPESHIIPLAIQAVLTNNPFHLFGTDYDTKDGTCVRDYIHVLDLVEAHVLALNKLNTQTQKGGLVYNVGTGYGYTNKEVVEMVKKVSGVDFQVTYSNRREGDPAVLIANPTKIKNELNFQPKYSELNTIVESAWKWHKKNSKNSK